MISSLVCGSPTIISLTSSGTGMVRRRGKVAAMAARVESCSSWFLAARLVTNIPGGERRRREEEGKEEKRKEEEKRKREEKGRERKKEEEERKRDEEGERKEEGGRT